jgi:hypothetical protein
VRVLSGISKVSYLLQELLNSTPNINEHCCPPPYATADLDCLKLCSGAPDEKSTDITINGKPMQLHMTPGHAPPRSLWDIHDLDIVKTSDEPVVVDAASIVFALACQHRDVSM